MRTSLLRRWLEKAEQALGQDWERCDGETGRECRGIGCFVPTHRALVYLNRALEEMNRSKDQSKGGTLR